MLLDHSPYLLAAPTCSCLRSRSFSRPSRPACLAPARAAGCSAGLSALLLESLLKSLELWESSEGAPIDRGRHRADWGPVQASGTGLGTGYDGLPPLGCATRKMACRQSGQGCAISLAPHQRDGMQAEWTGLRRHLCSRARASPASVRSATDFHRSMSETSATVLDWPTAASFWASST